MTSRPYRQKQRAERRDQTRRKIIEAAITMHQTKGPAATTMADIADLANVGRVTVYRHFPDEAALLGACGGLFFQRHPLPDPEPWRSVGGAMERLRRGLGETYVYHRRTEAMMSRVLAETEDLPVMAPYHAHWRNAARVLEGAWPEEDRRDGLLGAALALALRFDTWRYLVRRRELTDDDAVDLMVRLTGDPH